MPVSKSQNAARDKYDAEHFEYISVKAKKGCKSELDAFIKSICPSKSRNQFINEAIEEKMYWEQQHCDSLPDGKKFYRSEEGRKAVEKLMEK